VTPHPALQRGPRELVQLAGEWRGGLPNDGTMVEEKLDGVRAYYLGNTLRTREGVEIGGVGHILHRLAGIERAYGRPLMLDGEFIAPGGFQATLKHIAQGLRAPEQGTLHLFDCLHADEWQANDCDRPLYERKAMLARLVGIQSDGDDGWTWRAGTYGKELDAPPVAIIPDVWCGTQADVEQMTAEIWARGGEGVMLKDAESVYRRERSNTWRKYKRNGWATRKVA
jgi:ATP-dependent DNA ligase